MKSMNKREGKKIAVMAAVIVGVMMFAFMPLASAEVTSFTVTPSTGIAGAVDSYNALLTTDGVTSINITIPAGFIGVVPMSGGVEIARIDFWNSSTKAYYGYATFTANDTNPTTKIDAYCEVAGVTARTTKTVNYAPGAINTFVSHVGGSARTKLPTEDDNGSINMTINCAPFYLDDVMFAIKQFVRNPTTAGDYTFYAEDEPATVTIATGGYGGAVRRGIQWILRTENSPSAQVFRTNWGLTGDKPVVGDWNGDGVDTIGVFRDGQWILSNSNTNPNADVRTNWGLTGDEPVVGDWNADGVDTIGVRRGNQWILSNTNTNPSADVRTNWGLAADTPITGDWASDGRDTIGVFRAGQWILSNSNTAPSVAYRFNYGMAADEPVTGQWI